jgi:hypothetical protein
MLLSPDQDVAQHRMSEFTKEATTIGTYQRELAQLGYVVTQERDLYERGTKDWEEAEKKRVELTEKYQNQILAAQVKTAKAAATEWNTVNNTIATAFTSHIGALIRGTETFGEAMRAALGDMIVKLAEAIAQMEILTTLQAAQAALFPGLAPLTAATKLIPHFQEGTPFVPSTQLALMHKGEMVIPSGVSDLIRGGQAALGGGTTQNIHLSLSAWDAQSVDSWLRGGGGKKIAQHFDRNANSRPTY